MTARAPIVLAALLLLALCLSPGTRTGGLLPRAVAQDLDLDLDDESEDDELEEDESEDDESEEDESEEDEPEGDEPDDDGADDESEELADGDAEPGPSMGAEFTAGFGFGMRGYERPVAIGSQRLSPTPFASASVSMRLQLWPRDPLSFDILLDYFTSMGMVVRESPLFAVPQDIKTRSAHASVAVAPTFLFGDGPLGVRLAVVVGYALRNLWPQTPEYLTPEYTISGPFTRPELVLPFSDSIRLRVGPELQWLIQLDPTLERIGVCCQGVGIGGQGDLQADVIDALSISLRYRESHAFIPSTSGRFLDVERYMTVGLAGRL